MEQEKVNIQTSIWDGTSETLYHKSIELIKAFEPAALQRYGGGYVIGYSGGKDSDVLVELMMRAGVKFTILHNHTTLDAPETVYYVRKKFKAWEEMGIRCYTKHPKRSFWRLCRDKRCFPTRTMRFCCAELKENGSVPGGEHAIRCFGVRKAESSRRSSHRDSIEMSNNKSSMQLFHFDNTEDIQNTGACYTKNYFYVNPLAYWSNDYLQDFIGSEHIEVNPLYKCGFKRIGCIGCPMSSRENRLMEFERYPKYLELFQKLAQDVWDSGNRDGRTLRCAYHNWQEFWDWWMSV